MYSVVLMMAMTSPADDVAFGRRGGCDGGNSCGGASSYSGNSCDGGGRGGFLGLRGRRGGSSCNGNDSGNCSGYAGNSGYSGCSGNSCDGGGFLGLRGKRAGRNSGGCRGDGHGCSGYHASNNNCGCCGVSNAPACCGSHVMNTSGCCGSAGTSIVPTPATGAPATGGIAPPVKMPEPPAKDPAKKPE